MPPTRVRLSRRPASIRLLIVAPPFVLAVYRKPDVVAVLTARLLAGTPYPRARLSLPVATRRAPASGGGRLGGGGVVDGAEERLDCGVERLDAAGGAAEDQRALERRDGQVGEDRGAPGGDAQPFEAVNQRCPPPREYALEVGAEFLVAGGQLEDHGGDRAAALVARALEAAGDDLGQRADERPGVIGVARGLVDHLLHLVARPGDGFAGEFGLAAGEVDRKSV